MTDAEMRQQKERFIRLMRSNNSKNEPTGPFTGRCNQCGSKNLWDDNMNYGCKDCGKFKC